MVGRREDLIAIFREQSSRQLCDYQKQKLAENIYVTLCRGLSLKEYVVACEGYCLDYHLQPCSRRCRRQLPFMSQKKVIAFFLKGSAFPVQKYKSDIALQSLLKMPLAAIRVGTPESGRSVWFLIDYVEGVNYVNVAHFAQTLFNNQSPTIGLNEDSVKSLLGLARSDRERELIRYSVMKSSGITATRARRQFGFDRMKERCERVEECIEAACKIREDIDQLSQLQDHSLLIAMGLKEMPADSETDSESDVNDEAVAQITVPTENLPTFDMLMMKLKDGEYNWFVLSDVLQEYNNSEIQIEQHLDAFYSYVMERPLSAEQKSKIATSKSAYCASTADPADQRMARVLSGEIVSHRLRE